MWHVIVECVIVAFGAGMVYGLFGGGSGLIMMPGYYYLMSHFVLVSSHEMQMAIGTTALTSGILGSVAAYHQYKSRHINFALVRKMSVGILVGMVLALILLNIVPSHMLKQVFGGVVILVAFWLLSYSMDRDLNTWSLDGIWNHVRSMIIGLLWFMLGVAVFNVPYLHKCKIQLREAVGTATFISAFFSFIAGILLMINGYFVVGVSRTHIGYVNILLCAVSIIPSSVASYIGAKISTSVPQHKMRIIYSMLIFIVGILMLFA
jgi:uncharacterized membrane protein YfcA